MNLDQTTIDTWNNADDCDCKDKDCESNHKLCAICNGTVLYGAHESVQPNSQFSWNVDHIIRKRDGGKYISSNLRITHLLCNRERN